MNTKFILLSVFSFNIYPIWLKYDYKKTSIDLLEILSTFFDQIVRHNLFEYNYLMFKINVTTIYKKIHKCLIFVRTYPDAW